MTLGEGLMGVGFAFWCGAVAVCCFELARFVKRPGRTYDLGRIHMRSEVLALLERQIALCQDRGVTEIMGERDAQLCSELVQQLQSDVRAIPV